MRAAVVSLALLVAGCGGDSYVRLSSGGAPTPTPAVPTGSSITGTSVYAHGPSGSAAATFGALLAIFMIGNIWQGGDLAQQAPGVAVPELEPTRRVNEQDCSKPITDWSANLRCK